MTWDSATANYRRDWKAIHRGEALLLPQPLGHWDAVNTGTHHFPGLCDECDAHRMARMTQEKAEDLYRSGVFGQDAYEAFMHVWAQGRVGWDAWKGELLTERSKQIAAIMREAVAAR
jgi:hypothetical protein